MVYRAIGFTCDNPATELEITFTEFQEQAGKWTFEILKTDHVAFESDWAQRIAKAGNLPVMDFQQLHLEFGEFAGAQINKFIEQYQLHYKVALIAFAGCLINSTGKLIWLGDGAAIAALTQLPVVNDFYSIDRSLGGRPAENRHLKEKLAQQSDSNAISNAVLVAFMGILRWRQEYNVFASETGASRNSIGGSLWTGQDA
jgi:anhydro-N-acetylmuramic acid kinase